MLNSQFRELEDLIKSGPTPELCVKIRDFLVEHGDRDPEGSHDLEDQLHVAVLRMAAAGEDVTEMTSICLEIDKIPFSRWYA